MNSPREKPKPGAFMARSGSTGRPPRKSRAVSAASPVRGTSSSAIQAASTPSASDSFRSPPSKSTKKKMKAKAFFGSGNDDHSCVDIDGARLMFFGDGGSPAPRTCEKPSRQPWGMDGSEVFATPKKGAVMSGMSGVVPKRNLGALFSSPVPDCASPAKRMPPSPAKFVFGREPARSAEKSDLNEVQVLFKGKYGIEEQGEEGEEEEEGGKKGKEKDKEVEKEGDKDKDKEVEKDGGKEKDEEEEEEGKEKEKEEDRGKEKDEKVGVEDGLAHEVKVAAVDPLSAEVVVDVSDAAFKSRKREEMCSLELLVRHSRERIGMRVLKAWRVVELKRRLVFCKHFSDHKIIDVAPKYGEGPLEDEQALGELDWDDVYEAKRRA